MAGRGCPGSKWSLTRGIPGLQQALLPLPQQVPGRPCGNLLVARGIGILSSGHVQGVEQGHLAYSLGRQALHKFQGPRLQISEKSVGKSTWRNSEPQCRSAGARLPGLF